MTEPAIIQGAYADLRFVRSRSVVQVIVELPIEAAPEFVRLFGAPNPGAEAWVTLARLSDKPAKQPEVKNKRPWNTLTPTEQSAIRCGEQSFEQYLRERHALAGTTADFVRKWCRVKSRAELSTDKQAAEAWRRLDFSFIDWLNEPRYTG